MEQLRPGDQRNFNQEAMTRFSKIAERSMIPAEFYLVSQSVLGEAEKTKPFAYHRHTVTQLFGEAFQDDNWNELAIDYANAVSVGRHFNTLLGEAIRFGIDPITEYNGKGPLPDLTRKVVISMMNSYMQKKMQESGLHQAGMLTKPTTIAIYMAKLLEASDLLDINSAKVIEIEDTAAKQDRKEQAVRTEQWVEQRMHLPVVLRTIRSTARQRGLVTSYIHLQ